MKISDFIYPDHPLVNSDREMLCKDGVWQYVTNQRWAVFTYLAYRSPKICRVSDIHDWLYGDDPDGGAGPKIINVWICLLRKVCPFPIETVGKKGYVLEGYKVTRAEIGPTLAAGVTRAQLMGGR